MSKRVGLSGVDPAHVDRVVRETLRRLTARLNADLAERGSRWRVPTEVDLSALERALRDFVPPERRWKPQNSSGIRWWSTRRLASNKSENGTATRSSKP